MKNMVGEDVELKIERPKNSNIARVEVPTVIASKWEATKSPRIRLTIGEKSVVCALLKRGENHFFMMGKYTRNQLGITENQRFKCTLSLEQSLYGVDLPIELAELMEVDPEGDKAFHELTPGRQRSAIYFVAKAKTEETRVKRAVLIFDNIKLGFTDPREFTRRR